MSRIFISYSRTDEHDLKGFLDWIRTKYEKHTVWHDGDIPVGTDWWKVICENIKQCDLFIYLISNDSLLSPFCQKELHLALCLKKTILPLIIRPLRTSYLNRAAKNLKQKLDTIQNLDFYDGFRDNNAQTENLIRSINELLAKIRVQPATKYPILESVISCWQCLTISRQLVVLVLLVVSVGIIATLISRGGWVGSISILPTSVPTTTVALDLTDTPTTTGTLTQSPTVRPTIVSSDVASTVQAATPTYTPSFTPTYTASPVPTATPSITTTPVVVHPVIYIGWQATGAATSIKPSAAVGEVGDLYGTFDFATVTGPNPKAIYSIAFTPQDWSSYRELQMGALLRNGTQPNSVKMSVILWTRTGSQLCFYEHGNFQMLGSGMNAVKFDLQKLAFKSCTDAARGSSQFISPLSNATMVSGLAIEIIPVAPGNGIRGSFVIDDIRLVK